MQNPFLLFAQGVAMGAADMVTGCAGGTIALIRGIRNELWRSTAGMPAALHERSRARPSLRTSGCAPARVVKGQLRRSVRAA